MSFFLILGLFTIYYLNNSNTKLPEKDQHKSMENVTISNKVTYKVLDKNFILSEDTLMGTKDVSRNDYRPNESREEEIGLINESGENIQKITSLLFSTDNLLDGDSHILLAKSQTFQKNF